MRQTRALRRIGAVLASLWVIGAGSYAYPGLKGEFVDQSRLAQMAQQHPPMIPALCSGVRGVESRDFVREDATSDRCWVDLSSFRRLYPEIAPYTDEDASAVIRGAGDASLEDEEDGALWGEVLKAAALVLGLPLLLGLTLSFAPFGTSRRTRMAARWAMGLEAVA
jgi:hypothetical protein